MKYLMIFLGLLIGFPLALATENETDHEKLISVVEASNLYADGQSARIEGKAILLLISQEHCSFCVQIKQEVIGPMIRSGAYNNKQALFGIHAHIAVDAIDRLHSTASSHHRIIIGAAHVIIQD